MQLVEVFAHRARARVSLVCFPVYKIAHANLQGRARVHCCRSAVVTHGKARVRACKYLFLFILFLLKLLRRKVLCCQLKREQQPHPCRR